MESLSGWWTNRSPPTTHPSSPANRDCYIGDQCVSRLGRCKQQGSGGKAGPCREPKLAARGMLFLSLAPSWHCQPICKPSPTSSTYKSTSLSQRAAIRPKDNGDKRRDIHQMCACHSDTRCFPLSPPLSHQVCHQPCHCLTNPRSRSGCIINTLCIATLTHNVHLSAV